MLRKTLALALTLVPLITASLPASGQTVARETATAPPPAKSRPEWIPISKQCATTARAQPSAKALKIAETAKDEFYYFGGHRIDSNGRLFSFGVIESEQEESDENITTYRLGHLGWWHVLRYWRLLAEAKQPVDAARRFLRLRGFADASTQPDDMDIANPVRLGLEKALQAIDNINDSVKLSPLEKEIMKEALIRAAINDVAWSAAFISAVMRQSGMSETEFEFSEAHGTYIYKAFEISLAETAGTKTEGFYRACPLTSARPRLGDLVCYHRHNRQHGAKRAAEIRGMILDDLAGTAKSDSIYKSHCDVVAHVDMKAGRVYVVGGNVQQAVTVKKLALRRRDGTLAEIQPDGCKVDGRWTFPKADPAKPVAPHYSDECSLNRKHWFVLLQAR